MAGFFISNAAGAVETAKRFFSSKPVRAGGERRVGDIDLLHFVKQRSALAAQLYTAQDGFILGCGTFYYDGRFGSACLEALWRASERDPRVFAEVGGHFAFVVCRGGKLSVVTDKTGTYHVYCARLGDRFYLSTSMLAIAECLPRLTLERQEVLELINVEAVFGDKTIFKEIEEAEGGVRIACSAGLPAEPYYAPSDERVSFDALVERYDAYCRPFAGFGVEPCCDVSAGHDSRTVVALFGHAGVPCRFNTNENTRDPNDRLVAERIAALLHSPITVYPNRMQEAEREALSAQCFNSLELGRDIYRSAYTTVLFEEKSRDFDLVLGGYGGELLRDKYSRPTSLAMLIDKYYVSTYIWMRGELSAEYRARLQSKFAARLEQLGERDIKKGVEKIYYFEKMRAWGGARITAFNQYCYRAHPLLDHALARYAFDFSLDEKAEAALQRRLFALVPGLAELPVNQPAPPKTLAGRALELARTRLHVPMPADWSPDARRVWRRVRTLDRYEPPPTLARATSTDTSRALASFLSLPIRHLREPMLLGRFATVVRAIDRYRSKVIGV